MNKKRKNPFFMILFFGFLFSLSGYSEITNLSNLTATSSHHLRVLAYGNNVLVVWQEEDVNNGSANNIYFTIKSNDSWSQPAAVRYSGEFPRHPDLGIDGNGIVYLAWNAGLNGIRKIFPQEFQKDNRLDSGTIPSTDTIENGYWDTSAHPDLFYRGERTYAVWSEGNQAEKTIKFSEKQGDGNWSLPVDITPAGGMFDYPEIAVDAANNVHVIYSSDNGCVCHTNRSNSSWSKGKPVNRVYHDSSYLALDIDNNGMLHALYRCESDIYYNFCNKEGNWAQEIRVSRGADDMYPDISAGENGCIHMVWCEADENSVGDIMYTVFSDKELGFAAASQPPVARFTMTPNTGIAPVYILFDASESYDPDGKILQYNWDFADGGTGTGVTISHQYALAGKYQVTLKVVDNKNVSASITKTLKIFRVHPPLNYRCTFKTNRNLFSIEYFFDITWTENFLNRLFGVNIVSYRVYRRVKGASFIRLATVTGDTFNFRDRRLEAADENRFEYRITAVDDQGNESQAGDLTVTQFIPPKTDKSKKQEK